MRKVPPKSPDDLRLVRESFDKTQRSPAGAVSCYDMARDLAGTVKGLPEDLADNPKYMEGFGV